jgi:hypothetical protein
MVGLDMEGMTEKEKDALDMGQVTAPLYEAMGWFGRMWNFSHKDVLLMPVRRRTTLMGYLARQLKKYPPMM